MSAPLLYDLLQGYKGETESRAVVDPRSDTVLTFKQFHDLISDFESKLIKTGLAKRQEAISISLVNNIEFVVSFLAVTSAGFIASPLNSKYKQSEFEFYLEDVKSRLLLVHKGAVEEHHESVVAAEKLGIPVAEVGLVEGGTKISLDLKTPSNEKTEAGVTAGSPPQPAEIAFILHTSGTTGRPKAVPLTHANMGASVHNISGTYELARTDVSYLVMPLFHVHGLLCGCLSALATGGTVVIPTAFSASHFWDDFNKYKCNWYTAVPTIHQILLKKLPENPPPMRFIRSCSSSLSPVTLNALEEGLKAPVLEAYAMTEACHQMTSNNLPPGQRKAGSVGVGHGVEVKILDSDGDELPQGTAGEICVKGTNVTPGYLNNPKANEEGFFKQNGFFRTGDEGRKDEDGFLSITGRIKELINRGGEKISPIELDGVMLEHPAVSEAVSFGAPDELYGQQVNAAVVLRAEAEGKVTEKDIQDFMGTKVTKFKIPARIFFTKEMPKTATGKIQRRMMVQEFVK